MASLVPEIKDGPVVCGGALKFSSGDRGLWDTSVSHCSFCLVFMLLHPGTTSRGMPSGSSLGVGGVGAAMAPATSMGIKGEGRG